MYFHQRTTLFSKRVIEGLRDIALIGSRAGGTIGGGGGGGIYPPTTGWDLPQPFFEDAFL